MKNVMVDVNVEGITDVWWPRRSSMFGCQSRMESSKITACIVVDGVEDVLLAGAISVETHPHVLYHDKIKTMLLKNSHISLNHEMELKYQSPPSYDKEIFVYTFLPLSRSSSLQLEFFLISLLQVPQSTWMQNLKDKEKFLTGVHVLDTA